MSIVDIKVEECIDEISSIPILGKYNGKVITPEIVKDTCIKIIKDKFSSLQERV